MNIKDLLKEVKKQYPDDVIGVNIKTKSGYCLPYYTIDSLLNELYSNSDLYLLLVDANPYEYKLINNVVKDVFTKNFTKVLFIDLK